ncbi:AAEL012683-PA [Aedes aegypti]|uniref:AAEL012683-PA n=2 Tax=Aedes aegypti TaxID=7159 RepID=A0A1S4FWS6_AEDAE|nr:uncharacterized protein LOC5576652 [Aedes aegypti]EAT35124.1 AAEL012683-PA [Aedes aegypti]
MGEETPVQEESVLSSTVEEQVVTEPIASVEPVSEEVKLAAEVEAVALSAEDNTVEETFQDVEPEVRTVEVQPAIDSAATGVTYQKRSDGMPQFMYDAVAKIAPEQGFTPGQFEINFESGSGKGDGFVAEMFRAAITEGDRKLVVLCKIPPINDARRQQFGSMPIFDREVTAYSNLLPIMYEFQREKGITEEMNIGFFNAPQCYLAYVDAPKEESVIIMDDLRLKDYRMWNKMVPVNYEHARLLMIQLGRLHAVSLALKDQRPEVFEQFKVPDPLSAMMGANEGFTMMMNLSIDRATTVLEPHEEKARQKLIKLKETMFDDIATITSPDYAEPYAVLGHGDCWINNMIYSYKRGVPTGVVLLDWQICRYVSPALDLLYFIFGCTDEAFRRQHYDEMIRIYYDSLKQLLEKLGGDPSRQFPYTALLRQLKACGKFGILMAVFMVPMLCTENQDLPDMDEAAEKYKESQEFDTSFIANVKSEDKYKSRMAAVIRDVIRYGYL